MLSIVEQDSPPGARLSHPCPVPLAQEPENHIHTLNGAVFYSWSTSCDRVSCLLPTAITVELFDHIPYAPGYRYGEEGGGYKVSQRLTATVQLLNVHAENRSRKIEWDVDESENSDCFWSESLKVCFD